MKKLIFIQLVFLFLSTILFADSNDIWLLNLENGFAPHSDVYDSNIGEISILGDVDIVYDTNSDSNTVKVGEGGNNCYLRYSNLKSDILAACGTVSIDFKIPNNLNDITGPVTFFHASHIDTVNSRVDANDSWWIGLTDKDTVRIFSRSIITDPNETYPDILDTFGDKIYDADVSLSPGWHTMEFKWTEVTKRDMAYYPVDQNLPYTPAIRETADIVMYIDEVECVNEPNTYWTPGNASVLNIGSFCPDITDQNHSLYEAGENNILLDNVRVLQPEYTDIILQQAPFTINNTSDYFYAYVPAGQTQGYLSVEIRTKTRIPEPLFDYEYCVLYYVNNSLINTANRVQNIEDCRDLILPTGEALPWVTKDQYWATAYSPNFDTNEAMINATLINFPVELKKDPYRMVFNVGDILVPGERNKFKIVGSNAFEREIRNFKLLVNYNDGITVPIDPNIRDIADTTNPIVPTTDFNVPYSARLDSTGGGIDVSVSGESYCIDSKYSYPSSAFRTLSATSAAQNWTTITIAVDGNSLNANTANYTLHRQLVKYGDHIDVLDTITNISGGTIGIRLGHEIKENNNSLTSTYMSGMKLPYKNNTYKLMSNAYKSWWNPSIYVCKSSSGIGLLARDKVFRNHIEFLMEDNAYGIHDRHFAIEAGKSYTHKWAIYPTSRSYYYDFVNAARRTLNANYLIDGVPLIASSLYTGNMNSVSDSDIDELYTYNAGKYAILFTTYGIDSDGNRIREHDDNGHRIFGPALFDPCMGDWCRYYTENTVIPRIKNVKPNVKFYPYFFLSPSSEPNAINIYPDDLVLTDSNTPYYLYKIEPGINTGTPCFIPTLTNDFGYACREYFSWALDIADGIYLDASSGLNEIVRSPNISSWDGYTCDVHLGSGDFNETDATYQFIRAMTNPALASLDYRMHYMKTAKLQGTQFWNNAPPFTEEETALQNLHFIETYNNNVARGQFTTPCGFANQFWIRDDADNGRCTWYKIIYGGLRIPYVILYKNGGLAGTILKDMYPIKPLELHPGYVLGENKIITVLSGEYGFGDGFGTDANNLVVRVYDSNGYRKYPDPGYTVRYDASAGSTVANVNINESAKEFAIVFRYNPNLPSFPIPTNEAVNISTVTDLRWCPSEDANNQKIYFDTNEVLVNLKDAAVYLGQTVPYSTSIMDLNRPLEPNTTYYWGVQTLDHNNQQINYTVWNFKTAPSTWSIDFENGFTASSGTINILGGDVNNADGHKNVYTLYDSSSDSMCARVGYDSNDNCHLNYASLDPNILGPSGTVTINFKTDGTQFTTNSVLFTSNTGQNTRPVWDLTLRKWNKIRVDCWTDIYPSGDTAGRQYDVDYNIPAGWHTLKFKWLRTQAYSSGTPEVREKANIQLWIDGNSILQVNDANWIEPYNSNINVGSYWLGNDATVASKSGEQGIIIDDVGIMDYNETTSRWYVDFENGFDASSGNTQILGGDSNYPYYPDIYTTLDENFNTTAVKVGESGADCHLNYASLDPNILGPSGTVTINFKTDGTQFTTNSVLFTSNTGQNTRPVWDLTLRKWNKIRVDCWTDIYPSGDTAGRQYDVDYNIPAGWHTLKFKWLRTQAYSSGTPEVREKANIQLWIDGNSILQVSDANWIEPYNSNINVGSYWLGNDATVASKSGEQGIIIDDVGIMDYNETISRWYVDFENGFDASSGNTQILGGYQENPQGNPQDIYTLFDSSLNSTVLRVGQSGDDCYLNYTGLNPNVLGANGTIALDFYYDGGPINSSAVLFESVPGDVDYRPYWYIRLLPSLRASLTSQTNIGDTDSNSIDYKETKSFTGDYYNLTAGWHKIAWNWKQTEPAENSANPKIREKARLRIWIDGNNVLDEIFDPNVTNAPWAEPANTQLNIGHHWCGGTLSPSNPVSYHSGEQRILIDNVVVSP